MEDPMKIIVLGTSAAFSGKNDGCSSYFLSENGKNYLIDTGPGCVSYLQNYISYRDINGIFISHLHADHVSDIYTLRYAIYTAQRDGYMKPSLPIYMPKSPKKTFKFIKDAIKKEFAITEISESLNLKLDGMTVSFKKTDHPPDTYAMRFECPAIKTGKGSLNKTVVYTADTGYFDGLVSFSRNADILIADATLQSPDMELENLGHMTAEQAGQLATEANANKLILTHIWPEYDKNTSMGEAKKSFQKSVEIAKRGLEITL